MRIKKGSINIYQEMLAFVKCVYSGSIFPCDFKVDSRQRISPFLGGGWVPTQPRFVNSVGFSLVFSLGHIFEISKNHNGPSFRLEETEAEMTFPNVWIREIRTSEGNGFQSEILSSLSFTLVCPSCIRAKPPGSGVHV